MAAHDGGPSEIHRFVDRQSPGLTASVGWKHHDVSGSIDFGHLALVLERGEEDPFVLGLLQLFFVFPAANQEEGAIGVVDFFEGGEKIERTLFRFEFSR